MPPHPSYCFAVSQEVFMSPTWKVWSFSSAAYQASNRTSNRQPAYIAITLLMLSMCLVFSATVCLAQSTNAGTVVGTVTDPSGAVISGANLTLTDKTTNTVRTTTSSDTGRYVFTNVNPGTYDLTVKHAGFAEGRVARLRVEVGQQVTANVPLRVGGATEQVEVQVTGTELQTLNSTIGNT